jgi:hypothetical protein
VEASSILIDLYNKVEMDEMRRQRLRCQVRLDFVNPDDMQAQLRGRPVYLAMDAGNPPRSKPPNLHLNPPLAQVS